MYSAILVTLDTSATDRAIIDHVKRLAKLMGGRVTLLHVATSPSAKFRGEDASGQEVERSRAYLEGVRREFEEAGVEAVAELAYGEPAKEIIRWVEEKGCDLVAMSTHGHRFMADWILGETAFNVQHSVNVPVLLLRAKGAEKPKAE